MAIITKGDRGIILNPAFIIGAIQVDNMVYVHCDTITEANRELPIKCDNVEEAKDILERIDKLIDNCL